MKVLVTGAAGMLGRAVVLRGIVGCDVVGVTRAEADLTSADAVEAMIEEHQPAWVVHCAAWTGVDAAETQQDQAMAGNSTSTENLATTCEQRGLGLTLISTDYVFAGTNKGGYHEDEPYDPVNYYGLTKVRAEERVARLSTPWQIIRTSWLFGDGKVNFVKTMRRLLSERETLRVVDDQTGCPTYADDLAAVVEFLVCGRHKGIFHGTNRGVASWLELAQEVARCLATEASRIEGCPSSEYPTAAKRPTNSVLLSTRLEKLGCADRPTWQDAVGRYVARLESDDVLFP